MKFLLEASYSSEAMEGLLNEGGTRRVDELTRVIDDLSGHVESMYWAFGATDCYVICELPDTSIAAALAMNITGTGMVNVRTIPLLTPQEIDKAAQVTVSYVAPGG